MTVEKRKGAAILILCGVLMCFLFLLSVSDRKDGATFSDLHIQPEGIEYVYINGQMALSHKNTVNNRLGRFISFNEAVGSR